ncbi:rhodanese-like domain-containing protein [Flavobacterium sp. 14A]|uniref:rhodanese-like domain-containing protein n=1 Tax=Flavobacterium sp. 14A TaxID=2735896 RepID=UPI00156FEEB0|nr:rhodanese-like domain-containing protein [Flavobacterium sp. 14A]NRT11056.1 rhodanese-related sulfurtransferase [Flavobacterium sp. 14A]
MKKSFYLFLLSSILFLSCQKQYSQNTNTVSPDVFASKIEKTAKPQILDVRTAEEFNAEHLANAKNIDWLGTEFDTKSATLDKNKDVYVYCRSGARSKKACARLKELGFTSIYELDGGFVKWSTEGHASTKE